MNAKLKNRIEAKDTSINQLLKDQKFTIDYFQREYRWQEKHIKTLVEDLSNTFLKSYAPEDKRADVGNYQTYYLGPVVFSINEDDGKKSIIDGQQRITSLTLLLIFLNHLQKLLVNKINISELIFSEKYGEKSFNMSDDNRTSCLQSLFDIGSYVPTDHDDETVLNMTERYNDIVNAFPEEINDEALPFFIDWLTENVIIVAITAHSDDSAYTIFETMNDRGLNLSPVEMLKGYILSKITDKKKRIEMNQIWKEQMQLLHEYGDTFDIEFFQAWFRGKYATTIRPGKANSENQDFELIGSRFHNWFKDNHNILFGLNDADKFYFFFKNQMPFYIKWYLKIYDAKWNFDRTIPHLRYIAYWGIAESLSDPMLLSAIKFNDTEEVIKSKLDAIARYIETFTVRRGVNSRKFSQTSIKYTMFNVIKLIRDNSDEELKNNIINEINGISEQWDGIYNLSLHHQNKHFMRHLLARITSYLDELTGRPTNYETYQSMAGKPFEIEHIWADKFDQHRDEFDQQNDFKWWRNYVGALLLLPRGTNQSFSSDSYKSKLKHYLKENIWAQTLHPDFYEKNPNFMKNETIQDFGLFAQTSFNKESISSRVKAIKNICESLWNVEYYISSK